MKLLMRGHPGYESARLAAMWNGRKAARLPVGILMAETEADVQEGVRLAAREGWRVSIRSGGHSWIATGVRDDALLIDLSALQEVAIDAPSRRAVAQPGVRGAVLNRLLDANGLFFPTGHCASVAVGGYLLSGGYGWNSRAVGPACFSVEAVDAVLADGTLVHADDESHPDLMWAARGSGPGFFAVVTRYYLRLQPAYDQVLRSSYLFAEGLRDEVLAWSLDVLPRTSASLEMAGKVTSGGTLLSGFGFCGPESADEVFGAFEDLPFKKHAVRTISRAPSSLDQLYAFSEVSMPEGRRYAVDGVWTNAPSNDVLAAGQAILDSPPTPESFLFWMLWGNVPTRADACWSTQGQLYFSPNAIWTDPRDDLRMELWAHHALTDFAGIACGTQFSDANPADRPDHGLEPEQQLRLEHVRSVYDPGGLFCGYLTPAESTTALGAHLVAVKGEK